ncbi:M48 family metallopeptidase [Neolewinella antarctica]|uniref:YgjP-like metallopeptidase domain-containing protein n=1 Tax=Neolewinella antarctica TaxID=442734 RepID=A0ABX0XET0_9BACT|nr:YgjP-like metallopeptidase domain-containing protein [Neolewinella antarctica]NJC27396.1 hypothetical protein [Neolewinella antarctica]
MARRRPKKVSERRDVLRLGDIDLPVRTITERGRANARASITQNGLIIRIPYGLTAGERENQISKMLDWARTHFSKKPASFARFQRRALASAYTFTIRGKTYPINLRTKQGGGHGIKIQPDGSVLVTVNEADPRLERGVLLPKLLAKFFAGWHLPEVTARVHELNDRHFQRPINVVKLSDTYARWGSCSSKGNINVATRLLLAPGEVMDAVIIHELAHLVEANHSARFWAQVARALPDYKTYDEWLLKHGGGLLFHPTPLAG